MRVLVIAPHPDDEVLGCGGTIAKLSANTSNEVFVAIATKGQPPLFSEATVTQGRQEALKAHAILGVKKTIFCDLPAAALDSIPHAKVNEVLAQVINDIKPEWLFIPFVGDLHCDHQRVFWSALVAARPNISNSPLKILAYETLSETYWNAPYVTPGFHPTVFINIENQLEKKLQAFASYASQVKEFPQERSLEALNALAILRGANITCRAAEAFVLIREIL